LIKKAIELGAIQETLVLPLWARARDAESSDPLLNDVYASEIVAKIDYDFTKIESEQTESHRLVWPVRAFNFDTSIRKFLEQNDRAVVINIGAGLDTTFQRVDDGKVRWINLELPDVALLRQQLIPDSEREITIARSVFDFAWMDDIAKLTEDRSILFMAAGVLCYFETNQIKSLFCTLTRVYPHAHFLFDAMSRLTVWGANRDIMKKSGMDKSVRLKWHLKKASRLKRWVDTLVVVDEYPMFSRLPRKLNWGKKLLRDMKIADLLRLYNMVHVRL
jgi:O-methyltransferase involved in polyketide biosynthesis